MGILGYFSNLLSQGTSRFLTVGLGKFSALWDYSYSIDLAYFWGVNNGGLGF